MKTKFILFVVIILATLSAEAQEKDQINYIEVKGQSELSVSPDIVYLNIVLREQMDGREKQMIDKLEAQLLKTLAKNDIQKEQLTIAQLSGIQTKIKRKKTDLMNEKHYKLKITELNKIDNLLYDLQDIPNISLNMGKMEHSNMTSLKDQLYVDAIKNARHKAEVLLQASGVDVGKILWIEEGYMQVRGAQPAMLSRMSMKTESEYVDNNVEIAKDVMTFEVRARYEIKE